MDLISISSDCPEDALKALYVTSRSIKFRSVKFFSHEDPKLDFDYEFIKVNPMGLNGYNMFQLRNIPKYCSADFVMSVESDGFIINPENWSDDFLKFDYIGAPWCETEGLSNRVGNSGFCIRSKKFLYAIANLPDSDINQYRKDYRMIRSGILLFDVFSCNYVWQKYNGGKDLGITYADVMTAKRFSREQTIHEDPENKIIPLGFHGKFLSPYHLLKSMTLEQLKESDLSEFKTVEIV